MFSAIKLIDKTQCSFAIPDFETEAEEADWASSLTPGNRFELVRLINLARFGEEAMSRPMDRKRIQILSMEEFIKIKETEDREYLDWLAAAERRYYAALKQPDAGEL